MLLVVVSSNPAWSYDGYSVTSSAGSKSHEIEIEDLDSGDILTYTPSATSEFGIAFSYKFLDVSMTRKASDSTALEPYQGKTDYRDYHVGAAILKSYIEVYYQKFDKLYLEDQELAASEYILNNKILAVKTKVFGAEYYYPFKTDYKFTNLRGELKEEVKDDGGSWLVHFFYHKFSMYSSSSLIPEEKWEQYKDLKDVTGIEGRTAGIGGGYGHLWSSESFYFSFYVLYGLGFQQQRIYSGGESSSKTTWSGSNVVVDISFGGYSKYFFYGISGGDIANIYAINNTEITSASLVARLFVGAKF